MARTVKLGFVGAGYMGQLAHIANYAKLEDVELVALAEGRPQLARQVADRYGIGEVYADHRELLEKADVEAVVAIMGFGLHHAVIPDLLEAGKHVVTEKPICIGPDQGQEMADLAESKGVIYKVGYMKRSDAGSRFAKEKIMAWQESGEVGKLRYIRCTAAMTDWTWGIEAPINTGEPYPSYEGEENEAPPSWMSEEEGGQYVSFVNFWIHQVNLIRYLAGQDYKLTHVSQDGLLLIGETDSGASVNLEMNTNSIKSQWYERFTVCFEKAEVELVLGAPMHRQNEGRVRISTEGERGLVDSVPFMGSGWSFHDQAQIFVDNIRGETPVISPASAAVKDLKIAEDYIRMMKEA